MWNIFHLQNGSMVPACNLFVVSRQCLDKDIEDIERFLLSYNPYSSFIIANITRYWEFSCRSVREVVRRHV
jgi:hypothetical protein